MYERTTSRTALISLSAVHEKIHSVEISSGASKLGSPGDSSQRYTNDNKNAQKPVLPRISLCTIIAGLVTRTEVRTIPASVGGDDLSIFTLSLSSRRAAIGIECALLLFSKISFALLRPLNLSVEQVGAHVEYLASHGMFPSRALHEIFSNKLPSFQATQLPLMKQAATLPDLLKYLELLADCIIVCKTAVALSDWRKVESKKKKEGEEEGREEEEEGEERKSHLRSLISCWQSLLAYCAEYLLLEAYDSITTECNDETSLSDRLRVVDAELMTQKTAVSKLYHVTQFEAESASSLPPLVPAHQLLKNNEVESIGTSELLPKSSVAHARRVSSGGGSGLGSVATKDCEEQYVLCSEFPPAIDTVNVIMTCAMKVRKLVLYASNYTRA